MSVLLAPVVIVSSFIFGYIYAKRATIPFRHIYRRDGDSHRFALLGTNVCSKLGHRVAYKAYFCPIVDGKPLYYASFELPMNKHGILTDEFIDIDGKKYKEE